MLLFKKLKNKHNNAGALQQFNNRWNAFKERIAAYLQRKSDKLSFQTKRLSLVFFCLLFGGSSIAIIIHSATTKQHTVSITKISKPSHSIQNESENMQADSVISKSEYQRVERFKNYLFQLQTDSLGKTKFDSILHARPQLLDSINLFEKMYLQQQ